MKQDIEQIRKLCDTYRTAPKILLIPSRRMKTQIRKTLADHDIFPLNLSMMSVKELAYNIAEIEIYKKRLIYIDLREAADAMFDLLKNLKKRDALSFFDKMEMTYGIAKSVTGTVLELLESGYLHANVHLEEIENDKRRKDLELIIKEYAAWKKANNCIDYTDVAEIAFECLQKNKIKNKIKNKTEYVSGYALQACEFSFLEKKIASQLNLKKEIEENGNDKERRYELNLKAEQINFFEAYGDFNESKEVLRMILQTKMPFDNVLIITPAAEPYSQLFYQLIQQYTYANAELPKTERMPITFGTGLPLLITSPAKLLMLLLDWIGSGYKSHAFINLFSNDVFDIKRDQQDTEGKLPVEEDLFDKLTIINLIKKTNLTWHRHSYQPCFEKHLEEIKERNYKNIKAEKAMVWLIEFVSESFKKIPEPDEDGFIDAEMFLESLKSIVAKYSRIYTEYDSLGLRVTLSELETSIKGRRISLNDAVEIIKNHMKDIRILNESPASGRIHLTTYQQASWIERKNVFVMGLGADKFPGTRMEDPLLLDNERTSPPMLTSVDRINKNIEMMNSILENITENLTCSYSNFDTVEIRECYPATLFYRLKEKSPEGEVRHVGFVLDEERHFTDENDYWIYHSVKSGAVIQDENGANVWPDGDPGRDPDRDPGRDPDRDPGRDPDGLPDSPIWSSSEQNVKQTGVQAVSASAVLSYLHCKYKYFLKHILHLKEIETGEFDAFSWLSAIETGNIYHEIFEEFISETITNPDILKSKETAASHIREIAEDKISAFEDELPTTSAFHMEKKRSEILRNVLIFAENEVKEAKDRRAMFVEFVFGEQEPIMIDLGEGRKIRVSGSIDRIDKMKDGSTEIIDYKTGSTYAFKASALSKKAEIDETNAQLALYYLALKEIARGGDNLKINQKINPEIKNIGDIRNLSYRFVTEKGNYDTISLPVAAESEALYKAAFLEIFKEIEKGVFPPKRGVIGSSDEEDSKVNCNYCNFRTVCKFASVSDWR
jgi:ATP-dependent helicase/nuclease subunit B